MHILISTLYGATLWFSAMAYALIVGANVGAVALAGPLFISGGAIFITVLAYAIRKLHTLFSKLVKSDART